MGLSYSRISVLRRSDGAPTSKDPDEWRIWLASRNNRGGRPTLADPEDLRDLKLKREQVALKKDQVDLATRELKLQQAENQIHQQVEEHLLQVLTPLRRLLDAFPRTIGPQANPENPRHSEEAIRNGLNTEIYSEMERILKTAKT